MSIVARPATPGIIYALIDPRPERKGQIRYIGKTENLSRRKRDYLGMVRRGEGHSPHMRRWFAKLARCKFIPIFRVMETCLFGLDEAEQAWIDKGRAKGWPLLNCREGGIGGPHAKQTRNTLSDISKARWADPEYVARWRAGMDVRWGPGRKLRSERHAENVRIWQANMAKAAERAPKRAKLKARRANLRPVIEGDIARVPLTREKSAIIDAEDAVRVSGYAWAAQHKGRYWRAKRTIKQDDGRVGTQLLNRFIMQAKPGEVVRHADGNQLNCRKNNLIKC